MRKLFPFIIACLFIISCSDDEQPSILDREQYYVDIIPDIPDADAVLISTKNSFFENYFGERVQKEFGTATAVFYSTDNGAPVDAGRVSIYSLALATNENGHYTISPSRSSPIGINFQNDVVWLVEGNSSFPKLNDISKMGWPFVSPFSHPLIFGPQDDISIYLDYLSDSDFTEFRILDQDGDTLISQTFAGNKLTHTFSASELAIFRPGVLNIQLEVSKRESVVLNGRKVYFINREIIYSQIMKEED